jgi:hypothetical protein
VLGVFFGLLTLLFFGLTRNEDFFIVEFAEGGGTLLDGLRVSGVEFVAAFFLVDCRGLPLDTSSRGQLDTSETGIGLISLIVILVHLCVTVYYFLYYKR